MSAVNWATATDAEKCKAVAEAAGRLPHGLAPAVTKWHPAELDVPKRKGVEKDWVVNYLTDPRAWWPLVEESVAGHVGMSLLAPEPGDTDWAVQWYDDDQGGHTVGTLSLSAAAAVCIAYLRWKGWEVTT